MKLLVGTDALTFTPVFIGFVVCVCVTLVILL